jgi:hypothetical protein
MMDLVVQFEFPASGFCFDQIKLEGVLQAMVISPWW